MLPFSKAGNWELLKVFFKIAFFIISMQNCRADGASEEFLEQVKQ